MNASDVINAIGSSPGIVTALSGTGTYSYTPTQNVEVTINYQFIAAGDLSLNSVQVLKNTGSSVLIGNLRLAVAKGQTLSFAYTSIGAIITSRSIQ